MTNPTCMEPDGADPCTHYQDAQKRISELGQDLKFTKDHSEKAHSDLYKTRGELSKAKAALKDIYPALCIMEKGGG